VRTAAESSRLTLAADIIKGFAAQAPASALEFVTTMGEQYKVEIEEDGIVTTQGEE
jgi:hypothetical protein